MHRGIHWNLTLVLLASLAAPPAGAQHPLGSEFRVNTYTTSTQSQADMASAADGSFVVVWHSYGQDGSRFGIFGQRYDRLGNPLGSEFQVNTVTALGQSGPRVASAADGRFVVVWGSDDGSFYGVFGQRFDAAGDPLGGEFQANTSTTLQQFLGDVASDDDGNFFVVWDSEHQRVNRWEVIGRRYDASGGSLGGELQISGSTTVSNFYPAVAPAGDGSFAVVWGRGSSADLFGRLYDASGNAVGGEFQVNTYTTGTQYSPRVASDDDGDFVVVWESAVVNPDIRGRRFDKSGEPVGGEFQVDSSPSFYQSTASIASAADGAFTVLWSSWGQDGSEWGIFGQRYDPSGARVGGEFQVNTYTTGSQRWSSVASTAEGELVFAWASPDQGGSGEDVFARRWAGTGPILSVAGSCPGMVTATISSVRPSTEVAVVAAANTHGFVKGGRLCPGTELEIGEPFQLPPTFVIVDGQGAGSTQITLAPDRCHVQALSLATCEATNVVRVPSLGDAGW
jgi:hypothetical protein